MISSMRPTNLHQPVVDLGTNVNIEWTHSPAAALGNHFSAYVISCLEGSASSAMKLKRFLLRYFPPGIILEYEHGGAMKSKALDFLDLDENSDVDAIVDTVLMEETLITESKREHLVSLLKKLKDKFTEGSNHRFVKYKELHAHVMPLTNCAFNKSGDRFITGSYDRTCKLWDTESGAELLSLEGHKNVVYAITFNNPYGNAWEEVRIYILAQSMPLLFELTWKLWSAETGKCYHTFKGHQKEVVCVTFNPQSTLVGTGSMDNTAKLWDIRTGQEGHTAEVISLEFNSTGNMLISGSFDSTVNIWDVRSGKRVHTLIGHRAEVSSSHFNFESSHIVTGSMDGTAKIWDAGSGQCIETLRGHNDEVWDAVYNMSGSKIATASADKLAKVYDATTFECLQTLSGHESEISRVQFNPQGSRLLTASRDHTARIWDPSNGECTQVLSGHTDEIFSCAFNYEGDTIITGSKDNSCIIWR